RVNSSRPGTATSRVASIISAEESTPVTRAAGQRSASVAVRWPGPQPRSTTVVGDRCATWATRSWKGRARSASNFRYCPGSQLVVLVVTVKDPGCGAPRHANFAILGSSERENPLRTPQDLPGREG